MESKNITKMVGNGGRFRKGHKKIGGRTKGTINKFTRLKNDVLEAIETRKAELGQLAFDKLLTIGASFVPKNDKSQDKDERIIVVVNNNRDARKDKSNRVKVLPTSEPTEN